MMFVFFELGSVIRDAEIILSTSRLWQKQWGNSIYTLASCVLRTKECRAGEQGDKAIVGILEQPCHGAYCGTSYFTTAISQRPSVGISRSRPNLKSKWI